MLTKKKNHIIDSCFRLFLVNGARLVRMFLGRLNQFRSQEKSVDFSKNAHLLVLFEHHFVASSHLGHQIVENLQFAFGEDQIQ